jgi:hypothetical protein
VTGDLTGFLYGFHVSFWKKETRRATKIFIFVRTMQEFVISTIKCFAVE